MQKAILIIIIVIILIAVILGVYFFMTNSNDNTNVPPDQNTNNNSNPNNFEIQGMKVEILKQGSGAAVKLGDNATVHYVGTLASGVKFDSSVDRNSPFTFAVGQGKVIKGWDLGVVGMKVGEKRKLTVPSDLGYGDNGFLTIPPKATLIFEVELLKIN